MITAGKFLRTRLSDQVQSVFTADTTDNLIAVVERSPAAESGLGGDDGATNHTAECHQVRTESAWVSHSPRCRLCHTRNREWQNTYHAWDETVRPYPLDGGRNAAAYAPGVACVIAPRRSPLLLRLETAPAPAPPPARLPTSAPGPSCSAPGSPRLSSFPRTAATTVRLPAGPTRFARVCGCRAAPKPWPCRAARERRWVPCSEQQGSSTRFRAPAHPPSLPTDPAPTPRQTATLHGAYHVRQSPSSSPRSCSRTPAGSSSSTTTPLYA